MEQKTKKVPDPKDFKNNKIIAAVGYLGILCLIPLLGKKDSPFAQFHGKQGLVLCILWLVTWVVGWIPFVGWALWVASIIFTVVGMQNVYNGKMEELPVIGKYAEQIKI
ncbi:MAG: DUF4870 domain-containing protein [Candidatus Magasanikbacteria bacterium]|nr:DUF4870 domain-containing protein [Candidatus Magasanikbacteria bacterium]